MNTKTIFVALLTSFLAMAALAQLPATTAPAATDCQFHILADDSFELFINGKSTWSADDYQNVVQKVIPVRPGDIITVTVTDKQGGSGGMFAAVILRGGAILATSKDYRYSINPGADFSTNPSTQNLRMPDLETLQRSFGLGPDKQPKKAWTQKSDRKFGVVHFKYVVPK